jgi:signal transduction histidine kinase
MRKYGSALLQRLRRLFSGIRFRLTLWFVAILALVLLVFSVFVYTRQAYDLRRDTVNRLENKTRQFQAFLQFSNRERFEGALTVPDISQGAGQSLQENDILAVTDLNGSVLQKFGPISSSDVNTLAATSIQNNVGNGPFNLSLLSATATGQSKPQEYLFLVVPISFVTRVVGYLILGSPVDPNGQLSRLLFTLLFGGLGTLLVAMVGGYWLADHAMHPVQTITQAAHQISETDLSRRLNLGRQDELGELADTFDQMLARLEAAFERQRQFTADASHELRTPLTIVNLEANRALAVRRPAKEYERALAVIRSENERMARLVNDLLTLSRMDAGQTMLNIEKLDLSDLALEVIERLAPIATGRDVQLVAGDLPELKVNGDRQFLIQMITNLVENAIKYTNGAEKCVKVETGQMAQAEKALAWVRVEDNGPGIPSENLEHIFDRFYQVDPARSRGSAAEQSAPDGDASTAGSGLGLSIVQWIAGAHGGSVSAHSQVGQGSTFEVRLPLADGVASHP